MTKFNMDNFIARFESIKLAPDEQKARNDSERKQKTEKFLDALDYVTGQQFGTNLATVHTRKKCTILNRIEEHIEELFTTGVGACYTGGVGDGKTNILLEIYRQIAQREWLLKTASRDYPCPFEFIERTCRYIYSGDLADMIREKRKPPIARYNFIDDFGVEDPLPYVLAGFDKYFNEITVRGLGLIISTNQSITALNARPGYKRMVSRMYEKQRFYTLPARDIRKIETAKPLKGWRNEPWIF